MREKMRHSIDTDFWIYKAMPEILIYQIITKILLFVIVKLLKQNALMFLYQCGRSAFTSGDLPYLFRTKGGWLVALVGLLALVVYTVFDINAMFILADSVLHEKGKSWWVILKEAFLALKYFTHPQGLFVTLYVSLLGPLIGTAVGFSFMVGFSAPNFVLTYISSNPWLHTLVILGVAVYLFVAAIYIYTFLYTIFKKEKINVAMKSSRRAVCKNRKVFLSKMVGFFLVAFALLALIVGTVYILPMAIVNVLPLSTNVLRAIKIFFISLFFVATFTYILLFCPMLAIRITSLYEMNEGISKERQNNIGSYRIRWKIVATVVTVSLLVFSVWASCFFDEVFPMSNKTGIIAHRAGGNLGAENTAGSLEKAISFGIPAAEIDVQRTKDGQYIIYHDSDLKKKTGMAGDPTELTYDQIREYRVNNPIYPWVEGEKIATLEEMLSLAKGKIRLFIELKGKSADEQMVRDVYKMLREKDMVSEVTVICFDYEMIEYIEKNYPELETGYLVYFSFGNLEELEGDGFVVETECLSSDEIKRIHDAGKKVTVWTVNSTSDLNRWLLTDVDYIVTDEVLTAKMLKKYIYNGEDEERILQRFFM